jgi:hypothetical protein
MLLVGFGCPQTVNWLHAVNEFIMSNLKAGGKSINYLVNVVSLRDYELVTGLPKPIDLLAYALHTCSID